MPRLTFAIFARHLGVGALLLGAPLAAPAVLHAAPAAPTFTVTISNMAYQGLPTTAKVGDTIAWTNRDTLPHTATAEDGTFDVVIPPGMTKTLVLVKAGAFKFYCNNHPMMQAVLNVAAKAS